MPVARFRSIEDISPAEGLRLACELSETALRLAGAAAECGTGVHRHPLAAVRDDRPVNQAEQSAR